MLSVATKELLRLADFPTLENRQLQEKASDIYKVKNNLSPPCIADPFKLNNSGYHLRNFDFIIPPFNFSNIWPALSGPYNLGKIEQLH